MQADRPTMTRRRWLIVGAVFAASLADSLTTWVALSTGDREAGPLISPLMGSVGVAGALTLRVLVPAAITLWVALCARDPWTVRASAAVAVFVVAYWAVVAGWNATRV